MFITAIIVIEKNWKQPNCLLTDNGTAVKVNEVEIHISIERDLTKLILSRKK